jgi:hypothetical protein
MKWTSRGKRHPGAAHTNDRINPGLWMAWQEVPHMQAFSRSAARPLDAITAMGVRVLPHGYRLRGALGHLPRPHVRLNLGLPRHKARGWRWCGGPRGHGVRLAWHGPCPGSCPDVGPSWEAKRRATPVPPPGPHERLPQGASHTAARPPRVPGDAGTRSHGAVSTGGEVRAPHTAGRAGARACSGVAPGVPVDRQIAPLTMRAPPRASGSVGATDGCV